MTITPYSILLRKRDGESLTEAEIRHLVNGACGEGWSDAQLGAFLMAAVIRGMDTEETHALTRAMLESGERWKLVDDVPGVGDKHSTGGVGDKISLVLSPLLAACGIPVAMLTGRGLGHTGGTADKLESIPGLSLELNRQLTVELLQDVGMAIGMATGEIAPADRKLYSLRDVTGTVESLPLITSSILSKKLATGTAGVVFDLKTGDGAFLTEIDEGRRLARMLVETSRSLGTPAKAVITDMNQPLGRWVGHASEVLETLQCLDGEGPEDVMEVTYVLCLELAQLLGKPLERRQLEEAITSGAARRVFDRWARIQGAEESWLDDPQLPLAPVEVPILAPRPGHLAKVANRRLGLLLSTAGGGRKVPGDRIDHEVSLRIDARLGDSVEEGQELARLYLRKEDEELVEHFRGCFGIEDEGNSPPLIYETVG
ncbi:MAG: thymidine phosphorylase [Acidobacteriota bacterium]|nr:thymidine phosphorylase [Acidobacteriota bacterium]